MKNPALWVKVLGEMSNLKFFTPKATVYLMKDVSATVYNVIKLYITEWS